MPNIIKFQRAQLPTKAETIQAIEGAQTKDELDRIGEVYEAARAYATTVKDVYLEADAAEVKERIKFRLADIIKEAEAKGELRPFGDVSVPKDASGRFLGSTEDSGAESSGRLTRRAIGLVGRRLQAINVAGRIPVEKREAYITDIRDNVIHRKARSAHAALDKAIREQKREFPRWADTTAAVLRNGLNVCNLRALREIIARIDSFTPSELEQIRQISLACRELSKKSNDLANELDQALPITGEVIDVVSNNRS